MTIDRERLAIARCLQLIRETRDGFLSPEYATHQPISSITERFACDMCAQAIETEFGIGTQEQRRLLGLPSHAEEHAAMITAANPEQTEQ